MKTTIELHDGRRMTVTDAAPTFDVESWRLSLMDASCGLLEIEGAENGYDLELSAVKRVTFETEGRR
jgi:hypothetical protein